MTNTKVGPYLKYALFCHDTEETSDGELSLNGVIDLFDIPAPAESSEPGPQILAHMDVNLAFCIGGATAGSHHLMVAIKAPGIPLDTPPPQTIEWDESTLFQRWIKAFRIPVQRAGLHVAAILLDGEPLGEASFLVRIKDEP